MVAYLDNTIRTMVVVCQPTSPAAASRESSPTPAHLVEQLNGIAHQPVRPRLKNVVPTFSVYAMSHQIGMVLNQTFVLVGDAAAVTLRLWIEDHHRDVKTPEHHSRNHGVLAPLQRRKRAWT